jgi:hypothetical protein
MQEVNAWLRSGKDFEVGKSLYVKYGTNSFFKSLLNTQGATPYNVKKLGAELKTLAPAPPAIVNQIKTSKPLVDTKTGKSVIKDTIIVTDQPSPTENEPLPSSEPLAPKSPDDFAKYLELKELLKSTYRQLERNMAELDISTKETYLHLCAKNILSLDDKIKTIWKFIDYFDEHGSFPGTKPEVVRTPAEEMQLLRQSTSKAKTRLKSPTCRDVEATKQLIIDNNKRIFELGGKVKS